MTNAIAKLGFMIPFESYSQIQTYAQQVAASGMVPRQFAGNPAAILTAWQYGYELGLSPMQSLKNIAVINGTPTIWGDALLALITLRSDCEDICEQIDGEGLERTATCTIKRAGRSPTVRKFSMKDATNARLNAKPGPWRDYPDRMLAMRARAFAARDSFPDALMGLSVAEEVQDYATPAAQAKTVDVEITTKETSNDTPMPQETSADEAAVAVLETMIADAQSTDDLSAVATACRGVKHARGVAALREAYKRRLAEIRESTRSSESANEIAFD